MKFTRRERRLAETGPYYKQRSWQLSAGFIGIVVVVGGIVSLLSGPCTTAPGPPAASGASRSMMPGTPIPIPS
ncbi:hypothetical protein ABT408_37600, partial [Streptomyces halstedii]